MEPLDTLPPWAQEIVVNQALGLLEEDKGLWTYPHKGETITIYVFYGEHKYTISKPMNLIY